MRLTAYSLSLWSHIKSLSLIGIIFQHANNNDTWQWIAALLTDLWEVSMIVLPLSRTWDKVFHIRRLATGSTPVVGSSRKIIEGLPISAMPVLNFLLLPPLNTITMTKSEDITWMRSAFYSICVFNGLAAELPKSYFCVHFCVHQISLPYFDLLWIHNNVVQQPIHNQSNNKLYDKPKFIQTQFCGFGPGIAIASVYCFTGRVLFELFF